MNPATSAKKTTTPTISALLAICIIAACVDTPSRAEPVPGSLFAATPDLQWRLPARLREISGLAASPDGRLFAHDDETAVIYQIDMEAGAFVKTFALGEPALIGDFEGLAITPEGDFWLTTSTGELYRFREGADSAHVGYERFDAGLSGVCEVEGLAYLAAETSLIIACKRSYERNGGAPLRSWVIGEDATTPWLIPRESLASVAGVRRFHPSGVEIEPTSGRVLVLSGVDGALVELDGNGEILAARALGRGHAQAEGVTIMPDGSLIIADEAGRHGGRALLSRYPRAP